MISLFIQCIVDAMYPEVAEAMLTVFERLGVGVTYPPDQTCCGQPAYNAGYRREAARAARRYIEIFEDAETIVCPSGSCVTTVRHHYPELFKNDPPWRVRAEAVGRKTFEFTQYLVDVLGVDDVGATYQGVVTYHDSCHLLRFLGVAEQPRRLIRSVRGTRLVEMRDSDRCCGFGGAFSVKYPEISTAIVDEKVQDILASGAGAVIGCDMGCLMNIQGRLSRLGKSVRVMHIAQLLASGENL